MTVRVLVFGRSGQVASELARCAGPEFAIRTVPRGEADLTRPDGCAALIAAAGVDAVINAAAYTAVDRAEAEPDIAFRVNAEAPGAMAAAAAARGVPFLHVSTDYVFDGSSERPWCEDDATGPLGVYGRTKLEGERRVAAVGGRHAILRTSWVHSAHGTNFVRTMLRLGRERDRLTVVDDQRGGPTAAGDVASALLAVARGLVSGQGDGGIYHFSGAPAVSWAGFARAVFALAGWERVPEIVPIRSEDWPTAAVRPRNSVLDCSRIRAAFGIVQPEWRRSLAAILDELGEGRA